MMNKVVKFLFGNGISQMVNQGIAIQQAANLVDQTLFRYIGADMPILNADRFDYVGRGQEAVGAVYECTGLITNKALEAPLITYEVINQTAYKQYKSLQKSLSDNPLDIARLKVLKTTAMKEVDIPAITNLLNHPNEKMNGIDFREMMYLLYLIDGNSYIYGNPKTKDGTDWTELFCLPDMKIISGGITDPVKSYFLFWKTDNQLEFPAIQIKHIKTANIRYGTTGSQLYGVAPLKPYLWELDYLRNSAIQADKQAKNGATFGVLSPKNKEDQWTKDQKDDFKERLIAGYKADGPLSRWFPSSVALDYIPVGLSIADLQLLSMDQAKADSIYRCFHVPLYKRTTQNSALNNLSESGKQFIYDAVWPMTNKFDAALTEFICTPYKKSAGKIYVIETDIQCLPEMATNMQQLATWLSLAPVTSNEFREAIGYGRLENPGMDEPMIPITRTLLSSAMAGQNPDLQTASNANSLSMGKEN